MEIVDQSYQILTEIKGDELIDIEKIARTCYKSEILMNGSTNGFIKRLLENGHEAMIEHSHLSVKFITDRGISHEIVRHRLFSFAQESTRYVNYKKGIIFIRPQFKGEKFITWLSAMEKCEEAYLEMLDLGATPQDARQVLPTSVKTEIVVSGNYREWRHFFKLRTIGLTGKPHLQMVTLTKPLLKELQENIPIIFDFKEN